MVHLSGCKVLGAVYVYSPNVPTLSLKHVVDIFCKNEQTNILGVTVYTVQVYTVHMFSKPVRAREAGSPRAKMKQPIGDEYSEF